MQDNNQAVKDCVLADQVGMGYVCVPMVIAGYCWMVVMEYTTQNLEGLWGMRYLHALTC
jgi:hypothetical protein